MSKYAKICHFLQLKEEKPINNKALAILQLTRACVLWAPGDSNSEPTDYESGALTVELGALFRKPDNLFFVWVFYK